MSFELLILKSAADKLNALSESQRQSAVDTIRKLALEPKPPTSRQLQNRDGRIISVQPLIIIYQVDSIAATVTILAIAQRSRHTPISADHRDRYGQRIDKIVDFVLIDNHLVSIYQVSNNSNHCYCYDILALQNESPLVISPFMFLSSDLAFQHAKSYFTSNN